MPYTYTQLIWNAKNATATKELDSEFGRCAIVVVEITTANFTGTIDLKGKIHEVSAFSNVPWIRQDQAAAQTPSISQIAPSGDTAVYRYVICGWWRFLQIVMTRSGGTITCAIAGTSHGTLIPRIVVS